MVFIIKASGDKEKFNPKKISRTIVKAGATQDFANLVSKQVSKKIKSGDKTEKILNLTLKSLNKYPSLAARYDLKRAIMKLGPTGFPFERYFARILDEYGYNTEVGRILPGKMITHEVDIIAKDSKNKKRYMVECKYHNYVGVYTSIKTALYVYARFLDLKGFDSPWVVTNTHCSFDVLNYAKGVNMRITSWDYPKGESLQKLITQKRLYPITILKNLNNKTKTTLFASKIMVLKDLINYDFKRLKQKTGLDDKTLFYLIENAKNICGIKD